MKHSQDIEEIKKIIYPVFKRLVIIHLNLLWLIPKDYREIFIQAIEQQHRFIADLESRLGIDNIKLLVGRNKKKPAQFLKNILLSELKGSSLRANILYEHTYHPDYTYPNSLTNQKIVKASIISVSDNQREMIEYVLEKVFLQRKSAILNLENKDGFFGKHQDIFYCIILLLLGILLCLRRFIGWGAIGENESYAFAYGSRLLILLPLLHILMFNHNGLRLAPAGRDLWKKVIPVDRGINFSTHSTNADIKSILTTTPISPEVEVELMLMFERAFAKLNIPSRKSLKPEIKEESPLESIPLPVNERPVITTDGHFDSSKNLSTFFHKRLPKVAINQPWGESDHKSGGAHQPIKTTSIEWNIPTSDFKDSKTIVYDLKKGIFLDDHSAELKPGRLTDGGRETPWFVWLNMSKLAKEIPEETLDKLRLLLLQYQIARKGNGYWYVTNKSPVVLGKETITLITRFGFLVKSFNKYLNQQNVRILVAPIAETKAKNENTEQEQTMYLCSNTRVALHG